MNKTIPIPTILAHGIAGWDEVNGIDNRLAASPMISSWHTTAHRFSGLAIKKMLRSRLSQNQQFGGTLLLYPRG
ncbi:MAG: hypothetical protein NZ602_04710 [Thermoguttaceae bacterium]|nr:hypothetical protein [Thermoguttaceae bacterium]MDW8037340.1 hypothetical protein [Thermoguttaceae bacterium]